GYCWPESPATTSSSSPGGIFEAQPPPCAMVVRRIEGWAAGRIGESLMARAYDGAASGAAAGRRRTRVSAPSGGAAQQIHILAGPAVIVWAAEAYVSWWAPRSSKPVRPSISVWRVRFPSASAGIFPARTVPAAPLPPGRDGPRPSAPEEVPVPKTAEVGTTSGARR